MNLHQLRVFHRLSTAGSVSAAARELRVSQPAVSKQLAELEGALGVRLFDRLPRGVRLTEAGLALAEHAARVFAAERDAEEEMRLFRVGSGRRLRVGASTTIGSYLVPTLFGTLRKLEPNAELALDIDNTANVLDLVRSGRVDIGLTEGLPAGDEFESSAFSEDELVPITAPGDPLLTAPRVTLADVLTRPLLLRERGSGSREVLESALRELGHAIQPALELGSTEALKNAAMSRLGVAFVSSLTVDLELSTGRLARLSPSDFTLRRQLHVVELRYRSESPLVASFKRLVATPLARSRPTEYAI